MQNFTPIGRQCLILPQKEINKTKSGIIINVDRDSPTIINNVLYGVVIKKGSPTSEFHERDTVMFPRGCGVEQEIDDVKYLVVKYSDILAITY